MKKLSVLVVFIVTLGLIIWAKSQPKQPESVKISGAGNQGKESYAGVIRYAGLVKEEADRLGLGNYRFQLELSNTKENEVAGYYLSPGEADYQAFLGKCVLVTGDRDSSWEQGITDETKNGAYTYQRRILIVKTVEIMDYDKCQPYKNDTQVQDSTLPEITVSGIVTHFQRPSPDIGYDYQIQLEQPFLDEHSAVGENIMVNSLFVMPLDNAVWKEMEENMGKAVSLTGHQTWGFAESTFLWVEKVTSVSSP